MLLHEFGHSFIGINDTGNKGMAKEVSRSAALMDGIRADMANQAYIDWFTTYEETVLRAVVIDMMARNTEADIESYFAKEKSQGFAYIDTVYQCLPDYRGNRQHYPIFDDYVPVITDALLAAHG
jgi:hypothetical protein